MEKINKLKKIFEREKIDGYIIPKNDEFFGEYTPDYNDRLNFISGFTGSYGFALVLKNKNYLLVLILIYLLINHYLFLGKIK